MNLTRTHVERRKIFSFLSETWYKAMPKIALTGLAVCSFVVNSFAQTNIARYQLAVSSGTYTPITGGTVLATATSYASPGYIDDQNYRFALPAGFTFTYGGVAQTDVNVAANGFIGFGTAIWTAATYTALSASPTGGTTNGIISAFSRDLMGYYLPSSSTIGEISYAITGSGSDEVLVIQYKNFHHYVSGGLTAVGPMLNFQIQLYESTHTTMPNAVQIVYGNTDISTLTTGTAHVGIRGNSTTWTDNVNNLMIGNNPSGTTCNWANAVTGNANNSTMLWNNTNTNVHIPAGLTYTFTPAATIAPVRAFTAVTTVGPTSATVNWTAATGATQYNVQYRPVGTSSCSWTTVGGGPFTGTSATITGLTSGTQYQYRVQAGDGSNNAIWSHIPDSVGTGNGYTSRSFTTGLYPTDLQAQLLQTPASNTLNCYATNVPITIRIRNAGSATFDLGTLNAVVSGAVTSPTAIETAFTVDTLTGNLAAGATRDVIVYTGYDMSASGDYVFEANATVDGDMNTGNDDMPATTRTSGMPSALPQLVNFAGYTGTDASLNTTFPGWREATGTYPTAPTIGGAGSFTSLASAQSTAFGNGARMPLTGTNGGWIVSPKVNISATGYKFNFKALVTTSDGTTASTFVAGGNDTARIMVSTDCGVTWTSFAVFNNANPNGLTASATGLVDFSYSLDAYMGQNIMVAVYAKRSTTFSTTTADFIISNLEITSCSAPTALTVTSIGTTTATGGWTEPSSVPGSGYEWKVIKAGLGIDTAVAVTSGSVASGSTASITGLLPYTNNYDFYVRSSCGGGSYSDWAGPKNFQTACSEPTTHPTGLNLTATSTSASGTFTKAAGGEANGYMVVRTSTSLSSPAAPVDGTSYTAGTVYGPGSTCVYFGPDSTFNSTGLTPNTGYKFWVMPYNTTPCTGGPNYLTATPLNSTINTCPDIPSAEVALNPTTSGFDVYWEAPLTGGSAAAITYDLQISKNAAFTLDTATYANVTAIHSISGLPDFTKYWFRLRSNNGCYSAWTSNAADTIRTLPLGCMTPTAQPTALVLNGNAAGTAINGSFTAASPAASNYLVVRTTEDVVPTAPVDGTTYAVGSTALGTNTFVVANDTAKTFSSTGLTGNTAYTYYVYSFNHYGCDGGPKYLSTAPLVGADTTCVHAMSSVSTDSIMPTSFRVNWASALGGNAAPVTYTVEVTTDAAYTSPVSGSPFIVADPTLNQNITGLTPSTNYFYRVKASNGTCENTWVTGGQRTPCDPPAFLTTTDGSRCGAGTVTLGATADEAGATINWYAASTGGSSLGTGTSFITPVISDTTTYYAQVAGAPVTEVVGNDIIAGSSTTTSPDGGVVFTTTTDNIAVTAADLFVSGTGNMTFQLQNSSGTALATTTVAVSGATTSALTNVTFPSTFVTGAAASGYRLLCTSKDAGVTWYFVTGSYPKTTAGGEVSITSGWGWGATTTDARCVYKMHVGLPCVNNTRVPVVANVSEAASITASNDTAICSGESTGLNVSSVNPDYTYTWTPSTTLSSSTGTSVIATPTATTSYAINAVDMSGCTAVDTVIVTVNSIPAVPVVMPEDSTICLGQAVMLSVNMNPLFDGFETASSSNFATAGTGLTAAQNTTYYKEGTSSVRLSYATSANGSYAMSSDIDLNGLTEAKLSFWHIGAFEASTISSDWDFGKVDYSIDGGTTWTPFPAADYEGAGTLATGGADAGKIQFNRHAYTDWASTFTAAASTPGTGPATSLWKQETIDLSAYTTSTQFRVRFRIKSDGSTEYYGWLIDSVSIGGQGDISWIASPAMGAGLPAGAETPAAANSNITATPTANGIYSYAAVITSATGCTSAADTATITVNSTVATLGTTASPTTCGGNEGSITISDLVAGGTYTADYIVDGTPVTGVALTLSGTDATISGLVAGTYNSIVVTESGMCSSAPLGPVTLNDPASPAISSSSQTPAACGIDNGKIIISGTGIPAFSTHIVKYQKDGSMTYTYDTVFTSTADQLEITDLSGGSYDSISVQNSVSMCLSNVYGPVTISSSGVDSIIAPATSTMNYDQGTGSEVSYTDGACHLISTVEATNGALGTVTAAVTVGAPDTTDGGEPYMGRLFSFTATNNIGARVTIYLNQSDIDDYNAMPQVGSALYPSIGSSLENLQFTVFHSLPGSGDGPLGYDNDPSKKEVIAFSDMIIVAPTAGADYWSVTFDLDSFSIAIPHTNSGGIALPIRLEHISAVNMGATNRVNWSTLGESTGDIFEIERSADGKHFAKLDQMAAKGEAAHYTFVDAQPFDGINYYRLKLVNIDGSRTYSDIVNATVKVSGFHVDAYPNPVSNNLTIKVKGSKIGKGFVYLTDATGRTITSQEVDNNGSATINMSHLAQGMYLVRYQDDVNTQTIKVDKK